MISVEQLEGVLSRSGATFTPLPEREAWSIQAAWRDMFWSRAREAGLTRGHNQFQWNAFTIGGCPAIRGNRALAEYERQRLAEYIVWSENPEVPMYRCAGGNPPVFSGNDVHVFPVDIAWSMSFTHEDGWVGPFFARASSA